MRPVALRRLLLISGGMEQPVEFVLELLFSVWSNPMSRYLFSVKTRKMRGQCAQREFTCLRICLELCPGGQCGFVPVVDGIC